MGRRRGRGASPGAPRRRVWRGSLVEISGSYMAARGSILNHQAEKRKRLLENGIPRVECDKCGGTGILRPGENERPCGKCGGRGWSFAGQDAPKGDWYEESPRCQTIAVTAKRLGRFNAEQNMKDFLARLSVF
jgi:hypothetical protein